MIFLSIILVIIVLYLYVHVYVSSVFVRYPIFGSYRIIPFKIYLDVFFTIHFK